MTRQRLLVIPRLWFELLVVSAIMVTNGTVFLVDVVAFHSLPRSGHSMPVSLNPRNYGIGNPPSSRVDWTSSSHLLLKSIGSDNYDGHDVVVEMDDDTANIGPTGTSEKVDDLLALLDSVPSNLPTSNSLTDKILAAVQKLEEECPTSDESVLSELSGNWELLWTAQDRSSEQYLKGGLANKFINPLENQSYSNNPFRGQNPFLRENDNDGVNNGRANPVLPREIQDVLERTGILEASGGTKLAPIRSSQGIDRRRKRVRNVVNVQIKRPFPVKGALIVDVDFKPNDRDQRRIDVKFDSCRFVFQNAKIDQKFNLGILGPTGWLRTGYIDDRIRITRGHKGSVFILSRTAKRKSV
uniref:Plastid lipid-associated protein/fibrillin conserved domain-containing protein n=1 Tax=Pseudo-nitzschia australis TaxID=44445 RepID=A0A7S4A935_9STRA|mmetsp:Transcript_3416/g.7365  ORF Transcript_3416/g.7365 Transcript_3416/m.7365 type:complete len:355 (-) Transcript_3416:151-1215(-)